MNSVIKEWRVKRLSLFYKKTRLVAIWLSCGILQHNIDLHVVPVVASLSLYLPVTYYSRNMNAMLSNITFL